MEQKNTLYYILLEDKTAHLMPKKKRSEILKNILDFYKKIKPP